MVGRSLPSRPTSASRAGRIRRLPPLGGLVLKIEKAKSSFLLFKNGNIVCAGMRSEVDARNVIMKCIGELR